MAAARYIFSRNKGMLLYGNDVWLRNKILSYWEGLGGYQLYIAHVGIGVYSLHILDSLWPYCFLGCVNHHIMLCMESSHAVAIK